MTTLPKLPPLDLSDRWTRAGGIDGAVRVLGATAVVLTIEALAGYFLWLGMTVHLHVPDQLGWTLQVGLAGGSVIGTRAFHRGGGQEWRWGLALSVAAVAFLLVDGGVAALLHYGQLRWNAGWLAVGVLVECLIVGYLTVHTLMAGRGLAATAEQAWGPPTAVDDAPRAVTPPTRSTPESTPAPTPRPRPTAVRSPVPTSSPRSTTPSTSTVDVEHAPGWSADMAPTRGGRDTRQWVRGRAQARGIRYSGATPIRALRLQVEAAEVVAAGQAAERAEVAREQVPA